MHARQQQLLGFSLLLLLMGGYLHVTGPKRVEQVDEAGPVVVQTPLDEVRALAGAGQELPAAAEVSCLENDQLRVYLHPQGASLGQVVLKAYRDAAGQEPLVLLEGKESRLTWLVPTAQGLVATGQLRFEKVPAAGPRQVCYRCRLNDTQQVRYTFTLPEKGYQLAWQVQLSGFDAQAMAQLVWYHGLQRLEQAADLSRRYTSLQGYHPSGRLEALSALAGKEQVKRLAGPVSWVAYKQRFFTTGLVAPQGAPFMTPQLLVRPQEAAQEPPMQAAVRLGVPVAQLQGAGSTFCVYLGPNSLQALRAVAPGFEENQYLGPRVIKSLNRHVLVPLLDRMQGYLPSYLWALLLLALLLKALLLYFAYYTYLDSLKKKALQPEVAAIRRKYAEHPTQAQVEEMHLYSSRGIAVFSVRAIVSGLLQLPLFLALLHLIPNLLELRQLPFLWLRDLATYDTFLQLPFRLPLLGDHVSFFALLMAFTPILWKRLGPAEDAGPATQPWVFYLMSFLFFAVFNAYPAAFCLYRIVATCIDQLPPYLFKYCVDEAYHLARLHEQQGVGPDPAKPSRQLARLYKKRKKGS